MLLRFEEAAVVDELLQQLRHFLGRGLCDDGDNDNDKEENIERYAGP